MTTRRLIILLCLLTFSLSGFSAWQVPTAEPPETGEIAPLEEDLPRVPEDLRSPRATMTTFLSAVNASNDDPAEMKRAISCLDLSGVSVLAQGEKGPELAVELKEIIDRTRLVVLEEISDQEDTSAYVFLRNEIGEVVIGRDVDGAWRFTSGTVRDIPKLFDAMQDKERVEGVPEPPKFIAPGVWMRAQMPENLRKMDVLLERWQWLGLLALVLVGMILDKLVTAIVSGIILKALKRRHTELQDEVVDTSLRPVGLFALALWWILALPWLGLPEGTLVVVSVAVKFLMAVAVVWSAYRLVDLLSAVLDKRAAGTETKFDDLLVPLIRKSLKTFVVAFGLVFLADNLNVNVSSLLAGLGLGGLAFALAAQDTVKNLFGSLTVLLDRPFEVGDWVVVSGVEGTVEEVGFRSTRIRTFYDSQITLPNSNLISAEVDNLGRRRHRRFKTTLGITYDTPPQKIEAFCEGVREIIRQHPYTRKDGFHVYMNAFGPSSLDVLMYMFFETPDWATELRERHRLIVDILRLADRLGVEFAFPTQTLHLSRATGPSKPGPMLHEASFAAAREKGMEEARDLVESTLHGEIPPPVGSDLPKEQRRGSTDDGEG